ncbi:MAG TPA: DNA polymerase III subunit delta [Oceanospirillales bacterium]|jgi:DNA polymerase-3 subunit delta|nr:DNA polymerase III subunit delta [Oleispira sp.]HCM05867.1 DNA polymerase III subunit delta [Oceanospirillales bacterium]|tara:strand:- start:2895 stop:3899 length:1005 start_codon:yes stop_codon:yes gene_type:complete
MKLKTEQLGAHLQKGLSPFYIISGDEPLLVEETCHQIRLAAKKYGIEERELLHAEAGFDWTQLLDETNAMSLFASRRLLEVRIPNGKPSDKGKALLEVVSNPNPDNVVLIVTPRLDAATQKTKWFKAIESAGAFIAIWPIDRNQLPGWLQRRIQAAGMSASQDAVALFAQRIEGNLLAGIQEIEKMRMMGTQQISAELVEEVTADSARYDAFSLADSCLLGNIGDASRILSHLKAEGHEAIMILGALLRKIRQLISLQAYGPQRLTEGFKSQNIWPKQQPPFKSALSRLSQAELFECLQTAEQIDRAIKGDGNDPWLLLSRLTELLTGVRMLAS